MVGDGCDDGKTGGKKKDSRCAVPGDNTADCVQRGDLSDLQNLAADREVIAVIK